jgi:hypothetical protein
MVEELNSKFTPPLIYYQKRSVKIKAINLDEEFGQVHAIWLNIIRQICKIFPLEKIIPHGMIPFKKLPCGKPPFKQIMPHGKISLKLTIKG